MSGKAALFFLFALLASANGQETNTTSATGDSPDEGGTDPTTIWMIVLAVGLTLVMLFIVIYCCCGREHHKHQKQLQQVQVETVPNQVVVQPQAAVLQTSEILPVATVQGLSTPILQPIDLTSRPAISSLHTVSAPVTDYVAPVFQEQESVKFLAEPAPVREVVTVHHPKPTVTKSKETLTRGSIINSADGHKVQTTSQTVTTRTNQVAAKPKIVSAVEYVNRPVVTSVVRQEPVAVVQPAVRSAVMVEKSPVLVQPAVRSHVVRERSPAVRSAVLVHKKHHSPSPGHIHGPNHKSKVITTTTTTQRPKSIVRLETVTAAPPQPVLLMNPVQKIHLNKTNY